MTTAEMKLTLTGLLLFVLYGLMSGINVHIYVHTALNCTLAQIYCHAVYTDLSVISSNEDLQKLEVAAGGMYPDSWISNQENTCKALKYEDTNTSSTDYLFNNVPSCAVANVQQWASVSCSSNYPFFCYENFTLVQENKTWEEALDFCRTHYTDLATFDFGWQLIQMKNVTNTTQTDSLWTGLRFLDGNWYWLNVKNAQLNLHLPSCPPEPYRCGARNTKTEQWENRDCEEKLNFLCFSKKEN